MTALITDITRQITEALKQQIGNHRFDLWFAEPDSISVADGKLCVQARDAFSLGRIRTQFDHDLRQLLKTYADSVCELVYLVAEAASRGIATVAHAKRPPKPPSVATPAASEFQRDEALFTRPTRGTAPAKILAEFAFGQNNLLAENAVKQIVASPGQISPLFLHGPVGCGKSLLLSRIVQLCRQSTKQRRGIYVTAEQFTSHFVEALKGRGLPVFRRKYRELDVLAVDDLQFFDNKRATLVEFQSTLDELQRGKKQILLAADRPPTELGFLGAELINRLSGGLNCRLNYPCESGRVAVLQRLCAQRSLSVPAKYLTSIAQRLNGDVRQLSGAVNRLHAAQLSNMDLDQWPTIQVLLQDLFQVSRRPISLEAIEQAVCDVCGVAAAELRSSKRSKRINVARHLAMWLARKHTGNAFSEIGLHYGGRSHSTVISAQQKVRGWIQSGESIPLTSAASCPAVDAIQSIELKLRIG